MDGFAWTVIGSVAGVVGAAAAIVFGLVPLLAARRRAGAAQPDTALADAGTATPGPRPPACPAGQAGAVPGIDGGGDTLPARNPVFTGRDGALADLAGKMAAGPVAVVAVRADCAPTRSRSKSAGDGRHARWI